MATQLFDKAIAETAEEALDFIGDILQASTEYSVIAQDLTGKILLWNEGARRIYGFDPEEVVGKVNSEILYTEADIKASKPRHIFDTALREDTWEGTLLRLRKNGQQFTARVVVTPRRDTKGIPVGFLLISKDLSDEIQLAEKLKETQFYTRSLIESNIDALMTTDPNGVITEANQQLALLTGYTREELIGTPFKNYFTDPVRAEEGVRRVLREGRVTNYELTACARDGRRTLVSYNASSFRDAGGKLQGVFATAREITKQTILQSQLGEQQAYNRSLIEASADALFVVAPNGIITDVNTQATRITGFTREQLINSGFSNYFTDSAVASAGVQKILVESGGVIGYELVLVTCEGQHVNISLNAGVFTDTAGKPLGVLATARDVTDRKQFERVLQEKNIELENASLAKDLFLAGMSHELRTPLNAIIGFTGTLLMKLPGQLNTAQEKQLLIVQTSAKHLLSLINDLLDLVKIESGKVELYPEPVACKLVLEEVSAQLRPLAEIKGLHFEVSTPSSALMLNTDRRALTQILLNLSNNAIKFTETGRVSIALTQQKTGDVGLCTRFTVDDTGVGIRAEDQPQLFKAFEQLGVVGIRRQGTGLGLHLSQKLAQLLGGHIEFTSEYGKGSRFTLVIGEN